MYRYGTIPIVRTMYDRLIVHVVYGTSTCTSTLPHTRTVPAGYTHVRTFVYWHSTDESLFSTIYFIFKKMCGKGA